MDRTMPTFEETARKLEEATKWLEGCPFTDGQPFYETAHGEIESLYEDAVQGAVELAKNCEAGHDIEMATRYLCENGPSEGLSEWKTWEFLANEAAKLK